MSWTVLSVGYPLAPVSEDAVGGAEQVLAMLDRALVQSGHRSIVIAPAGSQVQGTLVALPSVPDVIDDAVRDRAHRAARAAIAETLANEHVDIIHMHGIDFCEYLPAAGVPVLVTLHLPLDWYPAGSLHPERPRTFLHCVSQAQADAYSNQSHDAAAFLDPIPNGVDLTRFQPRAAKRNFAFLLGRICPEKGVDIAVRACKRAGLPLLIGGQVYPYPAHEEYFRERVFPLLDECRRFLGPLALARKAALLASARCLLIPSLAAETSSLVAMEAAASGTPVIAFRSGALPGIVEDGVTGFLVDGEEDMAGAIRRANEIDPARCRGEAELRFDARQTVEKYFRTYARLQSEAANT